MTILDSKSLREQIRKQIVNLYYVYGSDLLRVQQAVEFIRKAMGGTENLTKLDGQNLNLEQLADEIQLCPMFTEYNCIYIHDCNMDQLRESERKSLLKILEEVPPQTVLLFDVTGFDIYGGKTGKNRKPVGQNQKLWHYIDKNGLAVCLDLKTVPQLTTEILAAAKKRGCEMERPAAQLLATYCNCDSLLIRNELDKLCSYLDTDMNPESQKITVELIQEMVVPSLETTVYMLTNAILRHKTADAMHVVDDLLARRLDMSYLMAVIAGSMIDMQRACAVRYENKTVQDMMEHFGYAFRFMAERAFQDSMKQSPEQIAGCLQILCECEQKMHAGAADERVLFEQAIIEMLRLS
ncbi:MAG: DNA polymerase III subunit delta [Oscillospiraceae bacterium]|nr:DNA polymerase III subunit delta [Oscillospiraceae bacterium]